MLTLTPLGVNGPYPTPDGACSGYLLESDGETLLLDAGSGVLARLLRFADPAALSGVVISHFHGDHASDLIVLGYCLQTRGFGGARRLRVFGPRDEDSPLYRAVSDSPFFDFQPVTMGETRAIGGFSATFFPMRHPVPALGARIRVTGSADGDPTAAVPVLAWTGDTNTCDALMPLARDASLLLADACLSESGWSEAAPHLSAARAGALARDAGAKRLLLTHFSPRSDPRSLLREARTAFPDAENAAAYQRVILDM